MNQFNRERESEIQSQIQYFTVANEMHYATREHKHYMCILSFNAFYSLTDIAK